MPVARNGNGHAESNGRCANSCCRNVSFGHRLAKVFLTVVVVFFVFTIGMGYGFKIGYLTAKGGYQKSFANYKMMQRPGIEGAIFRKDVPETTRLFGTIAKVDGNKITVVNNAAQETIVVSQTTTIILSETSEIGLSALKPGLNIVSSGLFNKDKQLDAQVIKVM